MGDEVPLFGLDATIAVALYAAAGELQAEVAAVGAMRVTEADARRAVGHALQMQVGPLIHPEHPVPAHEQWPGRLGAIDVAILNSDRTSIRGVIEVKWCRDKDKLAEALWDALKMSLFSSSSGVEGAYLVYGASAQSWEPGSHRPTELFEKGEHEVADLLKTYDADWLWLLKGNKTARPQQLQARFATKPVAEVPIHVAVGGDWLLRCARVEATPGWVLVFDENGLPNLGGSVRADPCGD